MAPSSKATAFCIILIGAFLISQSQIASSFDLQNPHYYFSDKPSVALLEVAMKGDLSKSKALIKNGANPNCEGPSSNKHKRLRLLHYAIAADNADAVKILLDVGADPEMKTEGSGRALIFAVVLNRLNMLKLLLEHRSIKDLSPDAVKSLLFRCVDLPRLKALEILLDRGAPIDFPDGAGYTILLAAMAAQDYDMAEWLLQRGASVLVETHAGVTPAYSVEFHLNKFKPGTPTYNKVLHLKEMMQQRGAVFPALTPEEVRAKREKTKTFPSPR